MAVRSGLVNLLARVEERLRVRLHQAANRMEDADPIDVAVARSGVRTLDVVDRVTGFRERHRAAARVPEGERRPLPVVEAERRPELDGIAPESLQARHRARLREAWRAWERRLLAEGKQPVRSDRPDGGLEVPAAALAELTALWEAWRAEIREAQNFVQRGLPLRANSSMASSASVTLLEANQDVAPAGTEPPGSDQT